MPTEGPANRNLSLQSFLETEIYDEIWRTTARGRIMAAVPPSPDPQRLASAAFRLKHDVGKAVRWSATTVREDDPEALRRRLEVDLLRTRATGVFDAWMSEDGPLFLSEPGWMLRITRMSKAIERIRARLPHLSTLDREGLDVLDQATVVLAEESRALWRDVVSATSEGPSA